MATLRTIQAKLETAMAARRWKEWFGSESFNPEQFDLHTGARKLYQEGFFFSPERPLPNNLKTLRILRFEKVVNGNSVYVLYDPGTPSRGQYPRDRSPHWKIGSRGQYYNNKGRPVESNTAGAHSRARTSAEEGFPELLLEGDARLERYRWDGPRIEPGKEPVHYFQAPEEPQEI
jgi:hypothetical protein